MIIDVLGVVGAIAAVVTITLGVNRFIKWIYKRGEAAGKTQAEREAKQEANRQDQLLAEAKVTGLEKRVHELQNELAVNRHDQLMAEAKVAELEERVQELQKELDALRLRRRPRSG